MTDYPTRDELFVLINNVHDTVSGTARRWKFPAAVAAVNALETALDAVYDALACAQREAASPRGTDELDEAIRQLKSRAASKWDDGNRVAGSECDNCVMVLERLARQRGSSTRSGCASTKAET